MSGDSEKGDGGWLDVCGLLWLVDVALRGSANERLGGMGVGLRLVSDDELLALLGRARGGAQHGLDCTGVREEGE